MKNKIIIFPTDTVYGIGAKINDLESIKKIYEIKGRNFNKPLAVLTNSINDLKDDIVVSENLMKLAKAFWPGALTIIVETTSDYQKKYLDKTLGIRIPNHVLARKILKKQGPMKVTSVNDSNSEPINDYHLIVNKYQKYHLKIYKNKEQSLGFSSTVVDITNGVKILRVGSVSQKEIEKVLGE